MKSLFRLLLVLPCFLTPSVDANTPPKVVCSVGPLQVIVNEIIGSDANAELLIDKAQSPHHFQLRPSHLRLAGRADLLVWVSNEFESAMQRLQSSLPTGTHVLQLVEHLPDALLIGDGHDIDGHLWLSPVLLKNISQLIADKLSELDPSGKQKYQANAATLNQRLSVWLERTREAFSTEKPAYILDHQFLAYLERDLDLRNHGSLRNRHDHGGSIRSLTHLHHDLDERPARCLLVSRLPASRQAVQVSQQHELEIKALETLGDSSEWRSILEMYQQIDQTLQSCR